MTNVEAAWQGMRHSDTKCLRNDKRHADDE